MGVVGFGLVSVGGGGFGVDLIGLGGSCRRLLVGAIGCGLDLGSGLGNG